MQFRKKVTFNYSSRKNLARFKALLYFGSGFALLFYCVRHGAKQSELVVKKMILTYKISNKILIFMTWGMTQFFVHNINSIAIALSDGLFLSRVKRYTYKIKTT